MKQLQRAAGLCCLLLLLISGLCARAAEPDGSIRVLLTRLKLTDRADLLLDGSYTCGDMAFQQGSQVTLQVQNGSIYLYYEGMVRDMGKEASLIRHQLPGNPLNGIRFNGNYALYCGDLLADIQGGQLRCVMRLEVEEYLLGVLPHEMSTAFPLEALKAQAVAARTYALTHIRPDSAYDVVDNTNDQVYAGIVTDTEIIRKAVSGTEGICVYYQGKMVPCYYTASNGGLVESIENVWPSASVKGYVRHRADPYDLENPESPVISLRFPREWTQEEQDSALGQFLRGQLTEVLKKRGYSAQQEDIRVRGVKSVTLENPTDEDSGIYQTLKAELLVSVRGTPASDGEEDIFLPGAPGAEIVPASTPDPSGWRELSSPVTLTLSYFGQVELPFNLSMNGTNNELTQIREEDKAFVLEVRRFGHGVGMSQRGAQKMAASGWGYRQIMRFYYQGIAFRKVRYTWQTAPALSAAFLSTPAPPATPTPRPTLMPVTLREGEYSVIVSGIATDSTLNLRKEPNTTSDILLRLYYGQELAVTGETGDWLHVRTDGAEGYVMARYVTRKEEADGGQ